MKMDINKLNLEMAKSCMLIKDICEKAGIGTATMVAIRSGRRNASITTIGKIAKALNVPVSSLIEENE